MSSLRKNIVANFAGSVWTGVVSLVFIPLYIRLMGVESYGLVGFFLTLQAMFSLLDAGMSTTLNRELARLSASDSRETMRRLVRTLESIYWGVAVGGSVLILVLAKWIATEWVKPEKLSVASVHQAIMLMGLAFVAQWPLSFYMGGLLGLQKQVLLSIINAAAATLRGAGAVLVLWLVSPTIQAFFVWQFVVSLFHTSAVAISVWREIGGQRGARFDMQLVRSTWRFAAGITAIGVLSSVITQLDKLIVSKALSLETFGYYAFAGTVAASLYRIIFPVFSAIFPRFAQLVAQDARTELTSLFHRSTQTIAALSLPAATFVAFFSHEVLLLWTRDAVTAGETHRILSWLIAGTALSGILTVPYAAQLAYGWTRLTVIWNLSAVAVLIPALLLLTRQFGAEGAASTWLAYNFASFVIIPAIVHRRILRGELSRWYLRDVGIPLVVAVTIAAISRALLPVVDGGVIPLLVRLVPVAGLMQLGVIFAVPTVRRQLLRHVPFLRAHHVAPRT